MILLIREPKKRDGRIMPFTLLHPATYVRHTAKKPTGVVWHPPPGPSPDDLF